MRLWLAISAALFVAPAGGSLAQAPAGRSGGSTQRANQITLAGLRPGRDGVARAIHLYGDADPTTDSYGVSWPAYGAKEILTIHTDDKDKIETVTAADFNWPGDCVRTERTRWRTSLGLRVGDSADRVPRLYGLLDSRSPSTKGGQRLELLYYAFDWAGPDVPQVIEVLCTVEKGGKPGRVVEITRAASSL